MNVPTSPALRLLAVAALLLCVAPEALAQVTASLSSKTGQVGVPLQLQYQFLNLGQPDEMPPSIMVDGLEIRLTGRSQRNEIVNMQATSAVIFSYTVTPNRPGNFTIPEFAVQADGGEVRTPPVSLEVTGPAGATPPAPGNNALQPSPPAPQPAAPPPPAPEISKTTNAPSARTPPRTAEGQPAPYYGELVIGKRTAYVGELIPVELRYYFRADCQFNDLQRPTFGGDGFTAAPLSEPEQTEQYIDHIPYNIVTFRSAITSAKTGNIEIPPALMQGRMIAAGGAAGLDPFFDQFFQSFPMPGFGRAENIEAVTDARTLDVQLLPDEGRPENFSGAVGQFTMRADANPKSAGVGESLTLTVSVEGRGNFDAMAPPRLTAADGWRTEPPKASFVGQDATVGSGTKTFAFSMLAGEDRSATPGVEFSYFDPLQKKYVTLKTEPVVVTAAGSGALPADQAASAAPGLGPDSDPPLGADGEPALFFGDMIIPDSSFFVGMMIPVDLVFYFRGDHRFEDLEVPTFQGEGFTIAPLGEPERVGRFVGDVSYNIILYRTAITPATTGAVDVPPARMKGRIFGAGSETGLSGLWRKLLGWIPFLGFDGGEHIEVSTQARVLAVKPLPTDEQPEKFSGLVGQFTMAASVDPLTAAPRQPILYRLAIQGRGNFAAMAPPDLVAPDEWRTESLEPVFKADDSIGYAGTKTFEFRLFATEDRPATPGASMSFFDPFAQKYVKLEAAPILLASVGFKSPAGSAAEARALTPEEEKAADMRIPEIDRTGQLPQERVPSKVEPGEKFRFGAAEERKEEGAFRPAARLTMRDRIVRLLTAFKLNGVTESAEGLKVLLGPLILSEGSELPRLFAGQMEKVKVQAIKRPKDEEDILMVLFEMSGGGQVGDLSPFVVQLNLADLQPSRDSLLFGEVFEKLVPYGEKGAPLLDPLSLPSVDGLVKEIENQDLHSIVERSTEMMDAPAKKEVDEKTRQ